MDLVGKIIGYTLGALTVVLWVGVFGSMFVISLRQRGRERVVGAIGSGLILVGFVSFLAPHWAKWVPSSIEWPIGWAGEVVTFPSGMRAVSHDSSNRVQIYDANWKFLRGWHVEANGGVFVRTAALPNETLEIVTARTNMRYVFDLQGNVLEQLSARRTPSTGVQHVTLGEFVPTWPWLITLTHPFVAFFALILGFLVMAFGGQVRFNVFRRAPKAAR